MSYILLFLFGSIVIGLWAKPRSRQARLIAILAVALVLLFYFSPHRM